MQKKEWLITHLENTFLLCWNERRRWDRWVWNEWLKFRFKIKFILISKCERIHTHTLAIVTTAATYNVSIQLFFFAAMSTHKNLFYTMLKKAVRGWACVQLWLIIDYKKIMILIKKCLIIEWDAPTSWNCSIIFELMPKMLSLCFIFTNFYIFSFLISAYRRKKTC